jgi:hypothetical protein
MKFIAKNLLIITGFLASGTVAADFFCELNPYLGADYYQTWTRGQNDWKKVFPRSYRGATIYIGSRFTPHLGAELGYDVSTRTKKAWSLSGGSAFFSGTVPAAGISGTTKVGRSGGHIDLLGFLPVADCFDLFGSIGYGWVQNKIDVTLSTASASSQSSALASVAGKGRSVLRAGVGGSYMVNDMVGLRAKLGWETTSTLRVKGNQAFINLGYQSKGWKDTTALSIGAFVKF